MRLKFPETTEVFHRYTAKEDGDGRLPRCQAFGPQRTRWHEMGGPWSPSDAIWETKQLHNSVRVSEGSFIFMIWNYSMWYSITSTPIIRSFCTRSQLLTEGKVKVRKYISAFSIYLAKNFFYYFLNFSVSERKTHNSLDFKLAKEWSFRIFSICALKKGGLTKWNNFSQCHLSFSFIPHMDGRPQRERICVKSKPVAGDLVNYNQFIWKKLNRLTKEASDQRRRRPLTGYNEYDREHIGRVLFLF